MRINNKKHPREDENTLTTYSNEQAKPPLKITHRLFYKARTLDNQDENNLTHTARTVAHYEDYLSVKIKSLILERYAKTHRKVTLFDSGCGEGVFINNLLSDPSLQTALGQCVGVSIHYFSNIEKLIHRHKNRFVYYAGRVQDVLATMPDTFDFIFDVYGAFFYSKNEAALLSLFHHALTPGGQAYIADRRKTAVIDAESNTLLSDYLTEKFPNTFKVSKDTRNRALTIFNISNDTGNRALTMTKTTERFPLPQFDCRDLVECPAIPERYTFEEMRQGNAIHPETSLFFSVPQPMTLRSLPYTNEELTVGKKLS